MLVSIKNMIFKYSEAVKMEKETGIYTFNGDKVNTMENVVQSVPQNYSILRSFSKSIWPRSVL